MINIVFDDTVINPNAVMSLSRTHQLFTDSFYLGSTASAQYTIELSKLYNPPTTVSKCVIYDNTDVLATLLIDSIDSNDDKKIKYTFTDGMVNFNFNYNAKDVIDDNGGSATVKQIVTDICTKANIPLSSKSFEYQDVSISWYDDTYTARDYIGFVAEINGGYAIVNATGSLEFRTFDKTASTEVNVDDCDSFKLGEKHTITRVVYDNNVGTKIEVGDETGDTVYVDVNNTFIKGTDEEITAFITNIYQAVKDFTYYGITIGKLPIPVSNVGELVNFKLNTNTYPTIWGFNQSYNTQWTGGITLNIKSSKQTETKVIDKTTNTINSIRTEVNRQNGTISLIGQQQSEIENKLIHFQVRAAQSDVIVTNQSTETPTSYTSFQGDGMSIYVDEVKVAEATASRFNCNQGLGVQDWVIQQDSNGNTLNFFRKG